MYNKEVFYYGKPGKEPKLLMLRAGSLSLAYQSGNLRYIKLGDCEILRMIYPAVRDYNWGTLPFTIQDETIKTGQNSFEISYTAVYGTPVIFKANYQVIGTPNGSVSFLMKGEMLTDFHTNRIGICVLHPIEPCSGMTCSVTTPDGSEYSTVFPSDIAAHQPFKNIRQMHWNIKNVIMATLAFEGDVFETEDQRNWTDASFKTYSRPLELPFPYLVKKGEMINQKITLRVSGFSNECLPQDEGLAFQFSSILMDLPRIGIAKSGKKVALDNIELETLKIISFDHYRVDVKFDNPDWIHDLNNALKETEILGYKIELVLFLTENASIEINNLIEVVKPFEQLISSFLILEYKTRISNNLQFDTVYNTIKHHFAHLKIGAGTDANFAELNRSDLKDNFDFVSFSICPQVHAFDNLSLIENIAAQKYAVKSCHRKFENAPVHVSPVTLRQRFNAVETSSESENKPAGMPSRLDYRQPSLFTAAWTLGSIKALTEADAASVTYYETVGETGIFQGSEPTDFPEVFHSKPGMIFPVWYIFSRILKKNKKSMQSVSSQPLIFDGIALHDSTGTEIIFANYSSNEISVLVPGLPQEYLIAKIDETNFEDLTSKVTDLESRMVKVSSKSIGLLPLGIAFIKF